jgi:hypothetical protein
MSFPILTELNTQGRKAIEYMKSKGYKISPLNIVYFEGLDADDMKTVNDDRIDYWNDIRSIISNIGDVLLSTPATTEPGWYYRLNRINPHGTAQIAFGQYLDAWEIGHHYQQEALVQCGTLKIYRDDNEDGIRKGDPIDVGDDFGLVQSTTSDLKIDENVPDKVGMWSAGNLVGKYPSAHAKFIEICRSMNRTTFDTTLIDGSEFAKFS